jgi:hypothetical protein
MRVVLVGEPRFYAWWEKGARIGGDMWMHVDDLIQRKRGGEIEGMFLFSSLCSVS